MFEKNINGDLPLRKEKTTPLGFLGINEETKIDKFEKMLADLIKMSDTIPEAINKIVKAALVCEFGNEILDSKNSEYMVKSISTTILSDPELRKQAILIIDKFAGSDELNA